MSWFWPRWSIYWPGPGFIVPFSDIRTKSPMFLLFSQTSINTGACRKISPQQPALKHGRNTHSDRCWDQSICITRRTPSDHLRLFAAQEKSGALLLIYAFGSHKHTIKRQREGLWREAADASSHLLQPRLLMRQLNETSPPFPSDEICFVNVSIFLASRTFWLFQDGFVPLIAVVPPSRRWQNGAPPSGWQAARRKFSGLACTSLLNLPMGAPTDVVRSGWISAPVTGSAWF